MRLNTLRVPSYGTLSDTTLALGNGLTVVYGLNEAGKSTLLSAYADLVCGIPKTARMAIAVTRPQLSIHADVTMDDGSTLTVIRTSKKAPNDLLNASTSEPVSAEMRQALTQGLNHQGLMTRFGLDHGRLTAGGHALMNGEGDLADIIFEARSGTDVRVLVDQLESRSAELFATRKNATALLNKANAGREDVTNKLKDTIATAEAVEIATAQKSRAEEELDRSRRKAAHKRTEHTRLDQLEGSWPYWLQYQSCTAELERIEAAGARLSSEDLRTVTTTTTRLQEVLDDIQAETEKAEQAQRERAGLAVDERLLAAQPAIDTIAKDKSAADGAGTKAAQLGTQSENDRAKLVDLLLRLGLADGADPLLALASIAVADDRVADLNELADRRDHLDEELHKADRAAREAAEHLEDAQRAATNGDSDEQGGEPTAVVTAVRQRRDVLWGHVSRSWLDGVDVPSEFGSDPRELAANYVASVGEADDAADDFAEASASHATVSERRRALDRAERMLADVQRRVADWQSAWTLAAEAAGLPAGLGVPGWRERADLLADAGALADNIRKLEREQAENAQVAAQWTAAAANLATEMEKDIAPGQLSAWFDGIRDAYEESRSNQRADAIHRKNYAEAVEHLDQLRDELTTLEDLLTEVASANRVDRAGLDDLVERTKAYLEASEALKQPSEQLKARHQGVSLETLTAELAGTDRDGLSVSVTAAKEALDAAEADAIEAHERAIESRKALDDLTGRTGADQLQQQLSQETARVLDLVEEYAVTRLMHHLLTQELRAYLESHRNPVLDNAGAYLSRLTKGRYIGLRAEGEGTDRSLVIVGSNDVDYVTADLSEGTASQLYLALSLAGVLEVQRERCQAGQERLPIMLDDVLMAFDDERAASALDLLAEIGEEQQIVLFTHHDAVRERANNTTGSTTVVSLTAPASLE